MSGDGRGAAWRTPRRWAQLGVVALLLANIRIPVEYLRLEGVVPVAGLMQAAIIAAAFALLSLLLHFFGRDRLSIASTIIGIATLLAFRMWQLPGIG